MLKLAYLTDLVSLVALPEILSTENLLLKHHCYSTKVHRTCITRAWSLNKISKNRIATNPLGSVRIDGTGGDLYYKAIRYTHKPR